MHVTKGWRRVCEGKVCAINMINSNQFYEKGWLGPKTKLASKMTFYSSSYSSYSCCECIITLHDKSLSIVRG